MIVLRFLHTFFWWIIIIFLYVTITTLILPFSFFFKKPDFLYHQAARLWAKLGLLLTLMKIKVKGLENVPQKGPLVIVSNHQSLMDIFILLAYLPRQFRFVVKKELFKIPFLGWYMRKAGYFSIDREVPIKAHRTLETIKNELLKGEAILFFPEGTRSPDGVLKNFKRGGFELALITRTPILPVAINGTYKFIPKGKILFNPVSVTFNIGKIIQIEKTENSIKSEEEQIIQKSRAEVLKLMEI